MQERARELYPPRTQTLNFEGSCLSNHCVPCHSNMARIGFRGPFSIGAILSNSSGTAGMLQLGKEQHQVRANHGKHSLASDWGLSQSPSPPRYYTHTTTTRWTHQEKRQGTQAISPVCCMEIYWR